MATGLMDKIIVVKSETVKYVVIEVPQYRAGINSEYAVGCEYELEDGLGGRSEVRTLGSDGEKHGAPLGDKFEKEVSARLAVVRAALQVRLEAAWQHRPLRLPGWLRAARNVAEHNFGVVFAGLRPQDYKATQRGKRKRRAPHPLRRAAAWAWRLVLLLGAAVLCGAALRECSRHSADPGVPVVTGAGDGVNLQGPVLVGANEEYVQEDVDDAYELDADGDGFVSKRELWDRMKGMGMTKGELHEQYKVFDLNADKKWSMEETLNFLTTAFDQGEE